MVVNIFWPLETVKTHHKIVEDKTRRTNIVWFLNHYTNLYVYIFFFLYYAAIYAPSC